MKLPELFPAYLANAKLADRTTDQLTIANNLRVQAIIKHSFECIHFDPIGCGVSLDRVKPVTFDYDDGGGNVETITIEKFPKALYFEAIEGFYGTNAMLEAHALRDRMIPMGGGGLHPYVGSFDREFQDQFPRVDVNPFKLIYDGLRAVPYRPLAQFEKVGIYLSPAFALMAMLTAIFSNGSILTFGIMLGFIIISMMGIYPFFVEVTTEVNEVGWTAQVNPFTNLSEEKWIDSVGAVTEEVLYYWPQGRKYV